MKRILCTFIFSQYRNYSSQLRNVRVRFAPSPTGFLHLGGLRTALYNYAFAKSHNGKFIVRIEDTDQNRYVPGAVEKIVEDLEWIGLIPDEGPKDGPYGPYIQSQRKEIYQNEVKKLINKGAAYYCFCSDKRLNLIRKTAIRNQQVPRYDNRCRHLTPEEIKKKLLEGKPSCVRFKLTTSEPYFDLIYGKILHEVEDIEGDPVILKSDGLPTYHLANVVDDNLMEISHVIRGVEWIQSTNKHLLIYRAFGYKPPIFAHLPLLLNSDGAKLSKRHGDITVEGFKKKGVFPRALINFLTTAGSGFKSNDINECYSLEELCSKFDLKTINTNSCRLPLERLPEFNKLDLARQVADREEICKLAIEVKTLVQKTLARSEDSLELDSAHIKSILKWCVPRVSYLRDLVGPNLIFLWQRPTNDDLEGGNHGLLEEMIKHLENIEFTKKDLASFLKKMSEKNNIPVKNLMQLVRTALSGLKQGPSVAEMMEILGKNATISRLERAINILKNKSLHPVKDVCS